MGGGCPKLVTSDEKEFPSNSAGLTLPIRYWFIADSRKVYYLLTLVDRLDFICKRKEVYLSYEKWKKKKKNLYYGLERVIYTGKSFSVAEKQDEVEPHRHWHLGLSVGGPLCQQDDEYLSFINRVFLNITKHSKLALFIEKYNSLSKKAMIEHITVG